jgi:hypothetical protein
MWFRDEKGVLIEIKRSDFYNDKEYFNFIRSKISDKEPPKQGNVLGTITELILR